MRAPVVRADSYRGRIRTARGERGMVVTCDQGGCTARATREIMLDNGGTLWGCSHHASTWFPWIDAEVRFSDEPCVIVT